ncbi:MAG TPA: ABC transporter substrate-binding protein [Solirubrobacteraceae bacterium]|nr:ABC transporter substrate-binding protein [Solirubrobacteraceae bacterium]
MSPVEPAELDARPGGLSRRQLMERAAAGGFALSAGALLAACGSSASTSTTSTKAATPIQGGTLRMGIGGGGPSDNLDPQLVTDGPDAMYAFSLFDQLNLVDEQMVLGNRLAEEFTPNHDATQWTVRVRQGVEFHNGKTLSADDVIFSFNRMFSPKNHATDAWIGQFVKSMQKVDPLTVRFQLNQPVGWFDLAVGDGGVTGIVPVDFDVKQPVGTGPFKFVSYSAGQEAVFERFPNYWGGPAKLDRLTITTINDDTARLNALLTHQIDMSATILASQVTQVKATSGLQVYNSPNSGCSPITMRVDKAPFSDVRVRQALRLCINRPQALETAYSGYGKVGADLYSPFDPAYDSSLQRSQDLEQAKSLLKQAGQSDLNVELVTAQLFPGLVQQCQVVAQNASQIGATINVRVVDAATLYGPNYLSWPFAIDIYPGLRYLTTSALADGPYAVINETHFALPQYEQLWKQASATLNESTRTQILHEMQQILFNQGGFIIPTYGNAIGALTDKVAGFLAQDLRGYPPGATRLNELYFTA